MERKEWAVISNLISNDNPLLPLQGWGTDSQPDLSGKRCRPQQELNWVGCSEPCTGITTPQDGWARPKLKCDMGHFLFTGKVMLIIAHTHTNSHTLSLSLTHTHTHTHTHAHTHIIILLFNPPTT